MAAITARPDGSIVSTTDVRLGGDANTEFGWSAHASPDDVRSAVFTTPSSIQAAVIVPAASAPRTGGVIWSDRPAGRASGVVQLASSPEGRSATRSTTRALVRSDSGCSDQAIAPSPNSSTRSGVSERVSCAGSDVMA